MVKLSCGCLGIICNWFGPRLDDFSSDGNRYNIWAELGVFVDHLLVQPDQPDSDSKFCVSEHHRSKCSGHGVHDVG